MTSGNAPGKKNVYVTLSGLPLSFELKWPFHRSTSGSDFWVLHTSVRLENGSGLHAPVAVNLSATLREVVPSLEAKDVEGPVLNALRKEVDRRQVEFVKSGKLVPVNFSSRHYDFKRNKWFFGKASDEEIRLLIARKVYWQTRVAGEDAWLGDPTEALYVDTTSDHLIEIANGMAKEGLFTLERRYARANQALLAQQEKIEGDMQAALAELEKKHAFERG
jgi:hypothetical protein